MKSLDAVLIVTDSNQSNSLQKDELARLIEELRELFAFRSTCRPFSLSLGPYIAIVSNSFEENTEELLVQEKSSSLSPPSHSPAPFLSELGTKKLEAVLSDSMTKGEKTTEEVAAAMHVDFFRVSANSGAGITSMFDHIARKLLSIAPPQITPHPPPPPPKQPPPQRYCCFCIPRKLRL